MTPAEVDRLLMRFEPRRILTLLAETNTMTFVGRTDVGGRPAYVIERRIAGGKWEQLAFDVESALLRRSTIFSPTPVGPDPEQIDFDDYRIVNGLATPFVIRTSYLDDNHYGTTVRFASVRDTP